MGGGRVGATGLATKLIDALQATGQSTFEAWVEPANLTQSGPARILSVGVDSSQQNFVLGQVEDNLEIRLVHTGKSGSLPRLITSDGVLSLALTHLVHTYDGAVERLYVNGVEHPVTASAVGTLANWVGSDRFNIGNEGSLDRPIGVVAPNRYAA